MTNPAMYNTRIGIAFICFLGLGACGQKEHRPGSQSETTPDSARNSVPESTRNSSPLERSEVDSSDYFDHDNLLISLGKEIPPEMMKQIEKKSQSLTEFDGVIGKGSKGYVVGLRNDGGVSLQIHEGRLAVFGYSYRGSVTESSVADDDSRLNGFKPLNEISTMVLDDELKEKPMVARIYESGTNGVIHAVAYGRGVRRTLAFYDSTKVEVSKLLPSIPDKTGMEALKKGKDLLRNR